MNIQKGPLYSALLHSILLILIIWGLPSWFQKKQPPVRVVSVEILPVKDISNIKSGSKPQPKKEEPKKPAPAKEVKSSVPEEVKPVPKPEPVKPEPKQEKKAEPIKPEKKAEPKPEKKEPPKKENPKEKPKKQQKSELESLLKTLEEPSQKTEEKDNKKKKELDEKELFPDEKEENSQGEYDPSQELSISEKDLIRNQIEKCWSVPAGAREAGEMRIILNVLLEKDGTVSNVQLLNSSHYNQADATFFQAAADSAMRAVRMCSPIQNLPPDKYSGWRDLELTFDPKDML